MPNDQNKLPDQFVHRFLYCIWLLTPSFLLSLIFHRPIICVDVLAFPLLESRLNRLAIVVLRLTWTLLFVVYLFGSWNIFPISYGFYLNSIGAIPLSVLGLSAVMLCVLMAFIMLPPRRWGNPAIPRVLFVICTVLFLAKALLSLFLDSGGPPTVPISTAGPSAVKFVYQHPFLLQHSTTDVVDAGATTFAHYAAHTPRLPNKVVLMVVESWGETENNLALMKERFNANGIVVAQSGFKIFQGATLQGEFREICSTFVELSTPALDKALKQRCAPQFFRDRN